MDLEETFSGCNKAIWRKLSTVYGIESCMDSIKNYIKFLELNKNDKINFGNYNVLIKCSDDFIDAEKLVCIIEELLEANKIINIKHIYMEPRQLRTNLLNTFNKKSDKDNQLIVVSSELVNLDMSSVQANLNKCIDENLNDVYIVLYRYDKNCWWRNDINLPKVFWKFELDEFSEDDKTSYIVNTFKNNNVKIDSKCNVINYLSNEKYEDIQKEMMEILIKVKSNNIVKLTNKALADLELRKYLKTKTVIPSKKGMQELMALQGLDNVKTEVQKIINYLKINKNRGTAPPSLHMMFYGKPRLW